MVKVEFAGLGLFFTLGNMTPRFLVDDLCGLDDACWVVIELGRLLLEPLTLLGLLELLCGTILFDEIDEDMDIDTDETVTVVGVTGGTVVVSGVRSSDNPTYLGKKNEIHRECD